MNIDDARKNAELRQKLYEDEKRKFGNNKTRQNYERMERLRKIAEAEWEIYRKLRGEDNDN